MFDSLYDAGGNEWQTKAFGCNLDRWDIGDRIGPPGTWQVEVLGGPGDGCGKRSYATVRDGLLASIDDTRDPSMSLAEYYGFWIEPEAPECPLSERVDGLLHTWLFDGDDPYVKCCWCGRMQDALTGRVIQEGRR